MPEFTTPLTIRVTPAEHEALRNTAEVRGCSIAALVKTAALQDATASVADRNIRAAESRSSDRRPAGGAATVQATKARRSPVASTPEPEGLSVGQAAAIRGPVEARPDADVAVNDIEGLAAALSKEHIVGDLREKEAKLTNGGNPEPPQDSCPTRPAKEGEWAGPHEWLPPIQTSSGVTVRECKWCKERKA